MAPGASGSRQVSAAAIALQSAAGGRATLLPVRAQPGARRDALVGAWNGSLKLSVRAPAEDGRANEALRELLAELFRLRPSAVELVRGHSARSKVFLLALPAEEARTRLARLLAAHGP
jgi:hypothetical protein